MPSLIGNLFNAPDAGSESESHSTDITSDGSTGLDLSPMVTIEAGGSYEELDGSTTTWSNSTSVGLDVGAQLDHAASLGLDDLSESG